VTVDEVRQMRGLAPLQTNMTEGVAQ
jgi:hypothetical protein